MLVEFHKTWFAPSEPEKVDAVRVFSGRRFQKGVHEVPEELRAYLPKFCKILDEETVEEEVQEQEFDYRELDLERASADEMAKALEQAKQDEEERQARVNKQLAKAREAKKAKRRALKPKKTEEEK